jgi:hypothetical protein
MLAVSLLLVAASSQAFATTLDVFPDGSGPYPTLQQALYAAESGDTIRLADGVYTGPGNRNLLVGGVLTFLSGSGDAAECVLDLEGEGRGFLIRTFPGTLLRIEGITLRGGEARGLPEDQLPGYGGGLAMKPLASGGFLHVENCVFEENAAEAGGGAFVWSGEVLFRGCVLRGNVATDGAGVYSGQCTAGSGVRFDHCVFYGNDYPSESVGGYGAGIYYSHSLGEVTNCTVAKNRAWLGGGILVSTASDVEIDGALIAFSARGEGLALFNGEVSIARSDIFGNAGGDWVGAIAGSLGDDCNFSADPLFCAMDAGDFTLRSDSPCLPENNDSCGLVGALPIGCLAPTGVADGSMSASGNLLFRSRGPIPFSRSTELAFVSPLAAQARLTVYDLSGRLVAVLFDEIVRPGEHAASWNGVGRDGEHVAPGVYFARIEIGNASATEKITLLR